MYRIYQVFSPNKDATNAADPFDEMIRKSIKCAEVLVPDKVEPQFVLGAYVANERALRALNTQLPVTVKGGMFF